MSSYPKTEELVKKHVASMMSSTEALDATINENNINYDNPEVHPQMMTDNMKDITVRLELALQDVSRLLDMTPPADRVKSIDAETFSPVLDESTADPGAKINEQTISPPDEDGKQGTL